MTMSCSANLSVMTGLGSHDQGEQLAALRSLKNDIVGHVQKKERWIEKGVLEPIVRILLTSRPAAKPSRIDSRGPAQLSPRLLTAEESIRLQALQILASFANGGIAFLAPIHAAGALSAILSNIPLSDNPPQVVIAALRASINIAEMTALALPTSATDLANLADVTFVARILDAFRDILNTPTGTAQAQTQRNLVAKLIGLLCRAERHQVVLADSGILDALATNLASVIVARGFAIPGAEAIAVNEGIADLFPDPAPADTDATAILEALSVIIGDSRWRASALVYAPAIYTVFPNPGSPQRSSAMKASANSFEAAGLSSIASKDLGVMDCLLPFVPVIHFKYRSINSSINSFPDLSFWQPSLRASSVRWIPGLAWEGGQSESEVSGTHPETELEETESPLIPWLIHTARASVGMERVMAASVVTSLFKAGFGNKTREAYMGRLIVPILLQNLEDICSTAGNDEASSTGFETSINRLIVERSLSVLAKLVVDSYFLQKCAFDCAGVKTISTLLKGAYEPLISSSSRPWSPTPPQAKNGERKIGFPTSRLGSPGQPPLLAHRIRVREAALKAVAALAGKDDYGRALVEQDLVPFIVESLSAAPSKPVKDRPKSPNIPLGQDGGIGVDAAYGTNPTNVIVAACHALRTLARSVSILRTTLQDCGVVKPAFRLLRHPDIEVQIAASGLMCNLVTNVSPMRDELDASGVMRVLCEQTRSQNPSLRLNALWALKHWVDGAKAESKKECVEELTPGWLVRLILDDTEDDALYQRTANNEKPTVVDTDEDVEMTQAGEESRTVSAAILQNSSSTPLASGQDRTPRLHQAKEKVADLREAELSSVRKVRDDDLSIQEQGLNFLRNLIGAAHSVGDSARDHADMIDFLFTVLGQDKFFDIMHSKLQLKVLHPFGRRYATNNRQDSRVLYPQARIVSAVVYILVHMAASLPRHRQILISQTKLLTDLGKQFQNKDKDVRVALCHLITNLTWRDDPDDEESSRARAIELKKLGLLTKLEVLESDDGELDVRERAKAAIWQINKPRF